ncbi:hypothetical protein FOA52_010206 [Chlamydomonas sp. UWO 241]|nr:hypothetical protein FOA52_010206 [Chlamydomonas sp. UWO 241]
MKSKVASERLIVDILNEPDVRGWGWNATGPLFLRVMDAVYKVNPKVLFLVEGTRQQELGANWGDGFQTTGIVAGSGQDPNPFFKSLMAKPYLNQVTLSPHVYGPAVTFADSMYSGASLFNRLSNSFGYLTKQTLSPTQGYTYNGVTKRFPVVVGETGSFFENAGDLEFMESFKSYLLNTGDGNDGRHNAIPHMLYWCWNSNSIDTGGLVDSTEYNLVWKKVRWLNAIGLTPWYKTALRPPPPLGTPRRIPPPPFGWNYEIQFPPVYGRPPPPPPSLPPNQGGNDQLGLVIFPPSTYRRNGGVATVCRLYTLLLAAVAAVMFSALL